MSAKDERKGYTVEGTVDIIEQRELPNSDPAPGDNWTYQDQPWDKSSNNDRKR